MKIRRIYFSPDEFISGTAGMSDELVGAYWRFCALQYSIGRPIPLNGEMICEKFNWHADNWAIYRDYLLRLGKIRRTRWGYVNPRAETEIRRAQGKAKSSPRITAKNVKVIPDLEKLSNPDKELQESLLVNQESGIRSHQERDSSLRSESGKKPPASPTGRHWAAAFQCWNSLAEETGLPAVKHLTSQRRQAIDARVDQAGGIAAWCAAIAKVRDSPFLRGANERGWRADFDFFLKPRNLTKLIEGGYDPRPNASRPSKPTGTDRLARDLRTVADTLGLAAGGVAAGARTAGGPVIDHDPAGDLFGGRPAKSGH